MRTVSPSSSVKSSSGTMPVPVSSAQPWEHLRLKHEVPQLIEAALDLVHADRPLEDGLAVAPDLHADVPFARLRLCGADAHPRADGAGAVVHLGLRQVEQVFTLDVARAHVVANGTAGDVTTRIHHQHQFRLRHAPLGIGADADRLAAGHDFLGERLEEQLRPRRVVNSVIGSGAEIGLLHPGVFASQVGDAGGPDFLHLNRAKQRHVSEWHLG